MGRIPVIGRSSATGRLAEVYELLAARKSPAVYQLPGGRTPNIVAVHGHAPELMLATFRFSGAVATCGPLSWADRELVATATSQSNGCFY